MNSDSSRSFPIVEPFFIGGVGDEVTASSAILQIKTSDGRIAHVMIDAGAGQGEEEFRNFEYPIHGDKIDAIVLTHSHYDHIGDLALLYKTGFRGNIYASEVGKKLSYPMLVDAAGIQERNPSVPTARARKLMREISNQVNHRRLLEKQYRGRKELDSVMSQIDAAEYEPLYTQADVEAVKGLFKVVQLATYVEVMKGVTIRMLPTTHQNGATRVEVHVVDPNGSRYGIAFSGDIGPSNSLLYEKMYDYTNEDIDCLVLESLHGISEPEETLEMSIKKLYDIIRKAIKQKKHVVLMGFSLDRNAMLVYLMNCLRKRGVYVDVVVDSPLTMNELLIYQSTYSADGPWFKDLGFEPFNTDDFKVIRSGRDHLQSVLHADGPRVIITASATGKGGRVVDYIENCVQRDDYVFVICGWVSPDSPSSIIHETKYGQMVSLSDRSFVKRCKTYRLHGLTSHGYYPDMVAAINDYPNLKTVVLNHSRTDDKVQVAEKIRGFFGGEVLMPEVFDAYELSGDATVYKSLDEILSDFEGVVDRSIVMNEYGFDESFFDGDEVFSSVCDDAD